MYNSFYIKSLVLQLFIFHQLLMHLYKIIIEKMQRNGCLDVKRLLEIKQS